MNDKKYDMYGNLIDNEISPIDRIKEQYEREDNFVRNLIIGFVIILVLVITFFLDLLGL